MKPWSRLMLKPSLLFLVLTLLIVGCSQPYFNLTYDETGPKFKGKIIAKNLRRNSLYTLCINGKVGQEGNEELKRFGIFGGEGYYDFKEVPSDERGNLSQEFGVTLSPGDYDVTFLVKDAQKDYECIFIRNHVRFTIIR